VPLLDRLSLFQNARHTYTQCRGVAVNEVKVAWCRL